ncbi:filamentous hemagglutinin N-terminal domain-containing protein [filamentous cyanobacterium LEGE 11480]|uniref:Filamentous hemagglutinin N-terminal domain-containing protein n=1 Tax=Romeriopsis navalis LEGE 11480 TaxID=2777977 RepID=A0A928VM94_9CYAN|nr:filamentous hemagglutinin N-terminal domain-containing protein [Romeriopsis navalis]MBE9030293.1 filamentous hemagglutinin N-terminal domain-containing protein [Romeriopsis navalis LEGE 11480]
MQLNRTIMPLSLAILGVTVGARAVQAQVVATPANQLGATGTVVTPSGTVSNITGGTTSGTNLFHSFSQFGLAQGATANFQTPAAIANVLSRVTGGTASVINGQIQLSGNTGANLYLMNPSGVIFGPNASLNVPASFIATTATAIGFQDNTSTNQSYFNAVGENIYANLTGGPTSLLFPPVATGSIVNFGDLSVSAGADNTLALFGNTVLQAADVNAPGANVIAASVPNPRVIRLSQPGNLLSLEFPGGTFASPNAFAATSVASLPALITGGGFSGVTNVQVNGSTVSFTGANSTSSVINAGDLATRNINVSLNAAGAAGPSANSVILISGGNLTAGNIANAVASGANIALTGSTTNSGTLGGGTVRLASGFFGTQGNDNGTLQVGNIQNAANISLESGGGIVGGALSTRGVTAGRNIAINLNSRTGNIRVINLLANNVNAAGAAGAGSNIVVNAAQGLFQSTGTLSSAAIGGASAGGAGTVLSTLSGNGGAGSAAGGAASVAANGTINITQLGGANANFIQGANLERDTNGLIIYRLASDQTIRVLINGINADGSLILRNAATGETIAGGGNVIVRSLSAANAQSIATGGGSNGLIIRLNGANSVLAGGLGLTGVAATGAPATTTAAVNRLNTGSQGVAVATQNGAVASGNLSAAQLQLPNIPVGDTPVVDPENPVVDPENPVVDPENPVVDPLLDPQNQLTQAGEQAQDQIELDNTADDLSGRTIRTAATRSGSLIAADTASVSTEEGVLTRRVERTVEVPVPLEAPAVVEKKEEEQKIEVEAPKKIKLLPQLW